jgi:hypothetical protein
MKVAMTRSREDLPLAAAASACLGAEAVRDVRMEDRGGVRLRAMMGSFRRSH